MNKNIKSNFGKYSELNRELRYWDEQARKAAITFNNLKKYGVKPKRQQKGLNQAPKMTDDSKYNFKLY